VTNALYFPSDLTAQSARKLGQLRVAGRVLQKDDSALTLVDAFASLRVTGPALALVEVGDLLIVRGELRDGALAATEMELRQPAPVPRGDGDLARLMFRGVGPNLVARARAMTAIRAYFQREGFIEVETPYRVPAPGVDRNVEAIAAESGWLVTSPELEMKRLVVGGVPRQFQLARVSRRDEAGTLHEAEFTLLEWYRAFAGPEEVIADTEDVVVAVAEAVSGRSELVTPAGRRITARAPFERLTVAEAFRRYAEITDVSALAASDPDRYFRLLVERVEPELAAIDRPLFLTDYPISEAALARPSALDSRFAERFELYVGGIELSNGYGELTDPLEQRARFLDEQRRRENEGRTRYPLNESFLGALAAGMPPTGGNALGVDRLLMLALGAPNVQAVQAFPRETL
jgi:lysyl-tRNA synthetase class 2